MPTTTDTIREGSVREGLARLLEWLTRHPHIPLASVGYVDGLDAELELPSGGFDTLTVVADAADALHGATIEVTYNTAAGKVATIGVTELSVTGTIPGDSRDRPGLAVQVITNVDDDDVRTRLLALLGAPTDHTGLVWDVTAEHLRGLVSHGRTAVAEVGSWPQW